MNYKFCPECGKPLEENSQTCLNCGTTIPQSDKEVETNSSQSPQKSEEEPDTSGSDTKNANSNYNKSSKSVNHKKKKRKVSIAYLIFLGIITLILILLINKKINAVEEKPMHSLPSERPQRYSDFEIIDTISGDTIFEEEISLLSPELPKIIVKDSPLPPPIDSYNDYDDYNDYQEDYSSPAQTNNYQPSSGNSSNKSIQLTTEQSIRNLLVSNRFVDPITSDVITFRNNGNTMLKNGDTLAVEMEVSKMNSNNAILDFYDSANTSWDIQLDISGQSKKIRMMDNTYISD